MLIAQIKRQTNGKQLTIESDHQLVEIDIMNIEWHWTAIECRTNLPTKMWDHFVSYYPSQSAWLTDRTNQIYVQSSIEMAPAEHKNQIYEGYIFAFIQMW